MISLGEQLVDAQYKKKAKEYRRNRFNEKKMSETQRRIEGRVVQVTHVSKLIKELSLDEKTILVKRMADLANFLDKLREEKKMQILVYRNPRHFNERIMELEEMELERLGLHKVYLMLNSVVKQRVVQNLHVHPKTPNSKIIICELQIQKPKLLTWYYSIFIYIYLYLINSILFIPYFLVSSKP